MICGPGLRWLLASIVLVTIVSSVLLGFQHLFVPEYLFGPAGPLLKNALADATAPFESGGAVSRLEVRQAETGSVTVQDATLENSPGAALALTGVPSRLRLEPSMPTTAMFPFTAATTTSSSGSKPPLVQDCEYRGLAKHLNSFPGWHAWRDPSNITVASYEQFVHYLTPWVVAPLVPPEGEPRTIEELLALRPPQPQIQCNSTEFHNVFSGRRLQSPAPIVDIIPFGYDLALLELRLLEAYEVVDLFVVSEADATHRGSRKPHFFDAAKDQPRFAHFRDKILHIVREVPDSFRLHPSHWSRETRMRGFPLACLSALLDSNVSFCAAGAASRSAVVDLLGRCGLERSEGGAIRYTTGTLNPLTAALCTLQRRLPEVLVMQNDEDEISLRKTLWHLKHCKRRSDAFPIYVPNVLHKGNLRWVQALNNGGCVKSPVLDRAPEISRHVWRPGPMAHSLDIITHKRMQTWNRVDDDGTTFMRRPQSCLIPHLGAAAGFHMSSVAELGQVFMKKGSVVEAGIEDVKELLKPELVNRGVKGDISSATLIGLIPCPSSVHRPVAWLPAAAQEVIKAGWPWAVRAAPGSFCFISGERL
eukprot:CAMPEP_0117537602 /NCGR_PEP_ID=MMETSP0784-20121206/42052_1 /TAXON_ID=39447 /ORGANISM="" /LENGTH=589 /DNA_ID=CAMNT_0005334199 /DNA_START=59 /DNA_END=1824 /DNA_ORIENTATION=+